MPKDNTLGAPTEGLGQTVTFAVQGNAGVPQISSPDRGSARTGVSGGNVGSTGQARNVAPAAVDPTIAALMKLGGSLLQPAIKREQDAAFMEGVQRASEGEAIKEIVDEQPWYSKLFGDTSLVDGARAQTASAKASELVAGMEADMDNLRKLDGKAMAQRSQEVLSQAAQTGDQVTDSLIRSMAMQQLPAVLKGQAKQHLRYRQDVFVTTRGDMLSAGADALAAVDANMRKPGSATDPADLLEAKARATDALVRPDGVDEDVFNKEIVGRATGKIMQGNFALYETLKDTGFLDKLPGSMQTSIEEAHQRARIGARAKLPIEFLQREAKWRALSNDPDASQDQIIKLGAEISKEYATLTGDRAERYFSNAQYLQEFAQLGATQAQEAAAKRRAAERDAKATVVAVNPLLATIQDVQQGIHMRDAKPAERRVIWKELNATSSPQDLNAIRATQAQAGIYDTEFKDAMNIDIRAALQTNDPMKLEAAYQKYWATTIKHSGDMNDTVALAYAEKDVAEVMTRYHKVAQGAPADANTIGTRYAYAALPKGGTLDTGKGARDQEDLGALKSGTAGRGLKALGRGLGMDTYPLENASQVLRLVKGYRNDDIEDAEQRVEDAIKRTPNLSVIGGYGVIRSTRATDIDTYWTNKRPTNEAASPFAPSTSNRNRVFRTQVDAIKDKLGIESGMQVSQTDDVNGVPRFVVMGEDATGRVVHSLFTADDAAEHLRQSKLPQNRKPVRDIRSTAPKP